MRECPSAAAASPSPAPSSNVPTRPPVGHETIRVAVDTPPFADTPARDPLRPENEGTAFGFAAVFVGLATVLLMLRTLVQNRVAWQHQPQGEPVAAEATATIVSVTGIHEGSAARVGVPLSS